MMTEIDDANQLAASLRGTHEYVSIGIPQVGRRQGFWPRYEVSWTEKVTERAKWGFCRTVWFQRRACDFVGRFTVICPAPQQQSEPPPVSLKDVAEIGVVRPGDRLLVRLNEHVTREAIGQLREEMPECLPGVEVIYVGGPVEQVLLVHDKPAAEAEVAA